VNPWLFALILVGSPQSQSASAEKRFEIAGHASMLADVLPERDVAEIRPQAGIELTFRPSSVVRLKFDGFAEGLVADRSGRVTDAAVRAREAWIELAGGKGDLRAGFGRVIWGRLDEIQPSDVINPLDTARYLFDGRSAARLPVAFVRGRWFASDDVVVEGVFAPVFRRATFDELDEETSPFNLLNDLVLPVGVVASSEVVRHEPETSWSNVSGGGRLSGTIGRVDVAAGVFRGFDGFGLLSFEPDFPPLPGTAVTGTLVERFPRFTMVSGDFESVTGDWAWRGEAAMFTEKTLQGATGTAVKGRAFDAGAGFDRRTGEFRVFASAILHRQWSTEDPSVSRTDVSLVGSIERQFGRDRYLARAFTVINPGDASGFVRGLFVWRVRDDVAVEGSAAAFLGEGDDALARFNTRDFMLVRVRWRL
jgi:hypothetical protein